MNNPCNRIDAIVLAAGSAARFGSDKRLYRIAGRPMLQCAIAAVIDAVDRVFVTLRENDVEKLPELLGSFYEDKRVKALLLQHPELGMGSNLAQAIKTLSAEADGVLVVLADMPFIQPRTVRQIVEAYQSDAIVTPVLADNVAQQHGHPVLFASSFFQELMLLTGDQGARSVLQKNRQSVIRLPVTDRGILQDLDVPAQPSAG